MEKKKIRFTVIDAVIILVVLAVVVVAGMKILPMITRPSDTRTISCTVLLADKEKELAEAMTIGDNVTMSLTEKEGGTITGVDVTPAKKAVFDSISGTYVTQEIPNKCDIYVTVDVDAKLTDTAVKSGSVAFKVGAETPVRGKGYAALGYMIAIND